MLFRFKGAIVGESKLHNICIETFHTRKQTPNLQCVHICNSSARHDDITDTFLKSPGTQQTNNNIMVEFQNIDNKKK